MKRWTIAAIVVGTLMYVVACSQEIYQLTSPPSFEWHVLLRKAYSVVAFALVGYLLRRALIEIGRSHIAQTCTWGLALYSGLIEVGQFVGGSQEGLVWNAIDVLCGALGGAVAVADRLIFTARRDLAKLRKSSRFG